MSYKFTQNKECEFFPCHKGIKEENFNCLFCWCPLYCLGSKCGGNPHYLEDGVKDCSKCTLPHNKANYDYIVNKFDEIKEIIRKKEE